METKNALAQFIGYDGWFDFIGYYDKKKSQKTHKKGTSRYLIAAIIVVVTIFLLFRLVSSDKNQSVKPHDIRFKAINPIGPIPHTVKFKYNIKNSEDSFKVNFGVMSSEYTGLKKDKTEVYNAYQTSGVQTVRVFQNDVVVDSVQVTTLSKGWESQITGITNYFPAKTILKNGYMTIFT